MTNFDYDLAFARNLGWVTKEEQASLQKKCVAIAGMGGVGGNYLITLVRMGVQHFHIAEFDTFELANFNRQVGATMSSLHHPKLEVMTALAKDINPNVMIQPFPALDESNLNSFLHTVDLYLDGLDFFAFDARQATFAACWKRGIPAITVAPLGMGAALLNFIPGRMSFEQYFKWGQCSDPEKALRFLVGLAPARMHSAYLVDATTVNLMEQRGPSTFMACQLCAGIGVTEALKLLLRRGKIWAAPYALQFDAYRNKLVRTWRPGGNNHPLQKLAIFLGKRQLAKQYPGMKL